MISCLCSSPDCEVNGCMQTRRLRQQHQPFTFYPSRPVGAGDGNTFVPRYLTEEEVRRIVQDELARVKGST